MRYQAKLIAKSSGVKLKIGDIVETFRGEAVVIDALYPELGQNGQVSFHGIDEEAPKYAGHGALYYPSVIGAEFVVEH